ncbi:MULTISPECIES: DUF4286 family protein [Sphingobacterium]|uniref:DUF4286 family protein n=1 Tax=Sphingobacterium tenebrionis TaxID=3111775 RepID=A0ABU8I5X5_9SPHI|nr:DUF4286 family protein [Sphingobacterium sp. 1.A.4]
MFLYNISIIMEDSVHHDLLVWIRTQLKAHEGKNIKFLKMLNSPHEGQTYCMQVTLNSEKEIVEFQEEVLQEIQAVIGTQFPDKAFIFDSTMQYINHE